MSTLFSSERAVTVSSPAIPQLDGRPFEGYAWKAFSNQTPMGEGSTNQTGLGAIVNNEGASATEVLKARRRESERVTDDWQSRLDQAGA